MRKFLWAALLLLAGCASVPPLAPVAPPHPLTERIWLIAEQRFIEPAELARQMAKARFVLLGESHDNPRHQQIEAWAVAALAEANRRPALVAEMIAADQAPALEIFFKEPRRSADGLDMFLKWSASGWPAWALYRPVFDAAAQFGLPIRAGNLDRTRLPAMHRDGWAALPAEERQRLALPEVLDAAVKDDLAKPIIAGHCGRLPDRLLTPFVEIQYARDAALARALADAALGADGAVLIAGGEHVRLDRAAPAHLARFGFSAGVFSLVMAEVTPGRDRPEDYAAVFDSPTLPFSAVWFTAGAARGDPCATLKGKFK